MTQGSRRPVMDFDPSGTGSADQGIFGLPVTPEKSRLWLISVPWEVTTSYGAGAAKGPETILRASPQVDLFDFESGKAYEQGYYMLPPPEHIEALNAQLKPAALNIRKELET